MNEIRVSIVIPFFNARNYVAQAVESALQQPETGEVLIIEDGSPDGGLEVCQNLAQKYPKVKLLRHPDGGNHGAAASRNLGIEDASFPFIAFLDADDFYLPNRFAKAQQIFLSQESVDGVYEAIGTFFQDLKAKETYIKVGLPEITTVTKRVASEDLFIAFMKGGIGHFSLDGFTARKELFCKAGYFEEKLMLYEDSFFMYKISAKSRLYPGNLYQPVAMRRVHKGNRITNRFTDKRKTHETMKEFWHLLLEWGRENLSKEQFHWVARRNISHLRMSDHIDDFHWREFIFSRSEMFRYAFENPWLLFDYYFWRRVIPSRNLLLRSR